jgi:Type IV pili methyl-accepting chemotaxis transducer N-term
MQISRRALSTSALFLVTLPFSTRAQAQISMATAINRAARLRALSQRSTKLYAQLLLDVVPDNAAATLSTAQRLMQVSVDDLRRASLKGSAANLYADTARLVVALTAELITKPSKDGLVKVNAAAGRLLTEADKLTTQLTTDAKQSSSRIIDIAGRQRMLSQRLAKNYFLQAADASGANVRNELTQDAKEYREAAAVLASAPISTPAIRNDQQLAQMQWTLFEAALARKTDPEALRTVATTSERLLEVNNNLTELYEIAMRDLLGSTG